jgi:hypothetical protein
MGARGVRRSPWTGQWAFDLPGSLSFRPTRHRASWVSLGPFPIAFGLNGPFLGQAGEGLGVNKSDWVWEPKEER